MSVRTNDSGAMVATVYRGHVTVGQKVASATIDITEPIPELDVTSTSTDWEDIYRTFYVAQAEDIYQALRHALPGGTLDALFGVMAREKASLFRVPYGPENRA